MKLGEVEGIVDCGIRTSPSIVAMRPRFEVSDLMALKASWSSWEASLGNQIVMVWR